MTIGNERGSALVTAMFFILGLTAIATIIVFVTGSERRVAHNEYTHERSLNASDAGSEQGINWIRDVSSDDPPLWDDNTAVFNQTYADLQDPNASEQEDNRVQFDIEFDRLRFATGFNEAEFVFGDYTVQSSGGARDASSVIEVQATRRYTVVQ